MKIDLFKKNDLQILYGLVHPAILDYQSVRWIHRGWRLLKAYSKDSVALLGGLIFVVFLDLKPPGPTSKPT